VGSEKLQQPNPLGCRLCPSAPCKSTRQRRRSKTPARTIRGTNKVPPNSPVPSGADRRAALVLVPPRQSSDIVGKSRETREILYSFITEFFFTKIRRERRKEKRPREQKAGERERWCGAGWREEGNAGGQFGPVLQARTRSNGKQRPPTTPAGGATGDAIYARKGRTRTFLLTGSTCRTDDDETTGGGGEQNAPSSAPLVEAPDPAL
jgi:hypothetical protein